MPTKLISNKALREFAALYADAAQPLQDFRRKVEKGSFANFAELRAVFPAVDKVGERFVFNIGGNKYRLVAWIHFDTRRLFVKAVLTHGDYDKGNWK
ncbi:MAG TPA: type II toxin-antitoxin system HigB family toxin [Rubrivivax sp.]|nr:type II toxin-antitoxin system HigB family toxin [Rubrivivax sp.]